MPRFPGALENCDRNAAGKEFVINVYQLRSSFDIGVAKGGLFQESYKRLAKASDDYIQIICKFNWESYTQV